jgi:hypothetical protein
MAYERGISCFLFVLMTFSYLLWRTLFFYQGLLSILSHLQRIWRIRIGTGSRMFASPYFVVNGFQGGCSCILSVRCGEFIRDVVDWTEGL